MPESQNPIIWLPKRFDQDSLPSARVGGDHETQSVLTDRRTMGEDRTAAAERDKARVDDRLLSLLALASGDAC
jgi:hypothetical protein